jgi:hypothetical protein
VTDEKTDEEKAAHSRADRRESAKREWSERPGLPDPTYDPRTGWKLDQFAMHCEADALREFKRLSFDHYHPQLAKKPLVLGLIIVSEFGRLINKRLLEPRYLVKGVRPNEYAPEVVSIPLLEHMYPIIETSELLDVTHWPEIARRRYEHVRVFEPARKAAGGRPATYDWEHLAEKMRKDGARFRNEAELVRYCRNNVLLRDSGKRPQPGSPDDKTAREAIATHEFSFFVDKD